MKPVLIIVVNDPAFFLSHRLPIAEAARNNNYDVHVATQSGPKTSLIRQLGFSHHELPLSRSGVNPFSELRAIAALLFLFWRLRPVLVHLVTIKPVLYGGIAARLSPVSGVVAAISGLGSVFIASGLKASAVRFVIRTLYRVALGKQNLHAVFQNPDDQSVLINMGAISTSKSSMIRGSGVDLNLYRPLAESDGVPVVTLAARLLKDKGVVEFVHAARILASRGISARFQLVGDPDIGNPSSISTEELSSWNDEGVIKWLGHQSNISDVFARSHIVVLPSYREGLPKVLVEAAACGRAVVTTDVPGCRDAIEADISGLLVPVRDAVALANAILRLLEDPELRHAMGRAGRKLAENAFAIEHIVDQHLDIYHALGGKRESA